MIKPCTALHQGRGQIANENRLTSRILPTMLFREYLYFQHMPHCDRDRPSEFSETECGKVSLTLWKDLNVPTKRAFLH